MPNIMHNGHRYEIRRDQIDVTSNHRPNIGWIYVDPARHIHRWYQQDMLEPATKYDPDKAYFVPTVEFVEDVPATDEEPAIGHYECSQCRARVIPGYTADMYRQFTAGMRHLFIDGEEVTRDQFLEFAQQHGSPEFAISVRMALSKE